MMGGSYGLTLHGGTAYGVCTEAQKGSQADEDVSELLEGVCHTERLEASPDGQEPMPKVPAVENPSVDLRLVDHDLGVRGLGGGAI
jgi:hypothetical protein